jgi:hypothetical protein
MVCVCCKGGGKVRLMEEGKTAMSGIESGKKAVTVWLLHCREKSLFMICIAVIEGS